MALPDPNQDEQIQLWNGSAGERWVRHQGLTDHAIEAFGRALFGHLDLALGESVLDIGCGGGTSLLQIAKEVGPTGRVLGLDASQALLDHARASAKLIPQAEFLMEDASQVHLPPEFDVLFSRFGIMFFPDPVAAFRNLQRALKPGGRFAFTCWQSRAHNPWSSVPLEAILPLVPEPPPAPIPRAPGPFAFEDKDHFKQTLHAAGFTNIRIESIQAPVPLGFGGVQAAVDFTLSVGPSAGLTERQSPEVQTQIRARLTELFADHPEGQVTLPGTAWLVTGN